jgi:dienelactone hydrolase
VLDGYDEDRCTFDGKTRAVFRTGTGPAVIVIAEVPGITPRVADFGRRVAAIGCTAVLPHLFGVPGRPPSAASEASVVAWACISREFSTLALRRTSPVTVWLRALARHEHERCGGPGVGVVGMCLTGGFALAMMVDDVVLAPVLAQPSMPFPVSPAHTRDLGISDDDLDRVKARADEGVCVLGVRFAGDPLSPAARFARLRDELGDAFISVELPGSHHAVLTEHLVDEPGHPTREALDQVLQFFRSRLLG